MRNSSECDQLLLLHSELLMGTIQERKAPLFILRSLWDFTFKKKKTFSDKEIK
uniref:Uncharacterized protein n=1 Tax=Rhizophora mucronata TaxID=61149 RepID=A0A2P2Q204_RHIMU